VILRAVSGADLDAYIRMRCDPVMMTELGGPRSRTEAAAKLIDDVEAAASDESWILMILPDEQEPEIVAGSVVLWSNNEQADAFSEIGWMVLPDFQGKGVAKTAVGMLLARAREDGRWGDIHAYPGVTNGPSNGICRSLGFELLGRETIDYAGQPFESNHWRIQSGNSA
jgi:RimJ/RimL family protein N-acetyltransferase